MKSSSLFFIILITSGIVHAQETNPKVLQQTARTFSRGGDYRSATVVLERALQIDGTDYEIQKDLSYALFQKKDFARSMEVARMFKDKEELDIQGYQILALLYKALEEKKEVDKIYKKALAKFPNSGVLLNEYGNLMNDRKEFNEAIASWEKGILEEPGYPGNYYSASKYYHLSSEKFWGLIYGELFVNLESYSDRTIEIKGLLLEGYKRLYEEENILKGQNSENEFENANLELLQKHRNLVSGGATPEALTAMRTRFMLDWEFKNNQVRFPFRLFDNNIHYLKSGLFEAYNQWLFGASFQLASFQQWTNTHAEAYNEFLRLQQNRVFKIPEGQQYR
jgi:hypothetical protein